MWLHTCKGNLDTYLQEKIFRINRYSDQSRRSDKIFLDEKLTFKNGDEYNLEAILQHEGQSVHGGHYIIFLFLMDVGNVVTTALGLYTKV